MTIVNLKPYIRPHLDVLFVALNPPAQSNRNGHYFSGSESRFFELLASSGLITQPVPKATADEIVFGSKALNYGAYEYGVVDLVENFVETNSSKVKPTPSDTDVLLERIRKFKPRFVCILHWKVRDALNRSPAVHPKLDYGMCGPVVRGCDSRFVLNYFPNGNGIKDAHKLSIFRALREAL